MPFDAELQPTSTDRSAPGVTYMELAPGLRHFRCEPYEVTLSTKSCAARWEKAQELFGDLAIPLAKCVACPTGAAHAGRGMVRYSQWYRAPICCRCGSGGRRMIGGRVCVSCYNRAREMKLGRNARGNRPSELLERPLHRLAVTVVVDGVARRFVDRETSGGQETMLQFLRTNTGEISFSFASAGVQPATADSLAADAGEDPPDADVGGWLITDGRCTRCGGRVLQGADAEHVHRCANCGQRGEGVPEADTAAEALADEAPGPERAVGKLEVARYRAGLFASTAFLGGKDAWAKPIGR